LRLRFELRNSQPQFVFRFCDFLDVNLQDFVSKFLARYFTKFSSLNTFSPEKRHISASSEGRIGPNSRVGAPPLSSRLRGPPRNRKSSGGILLRGCYTITKQGKVLPTPPGQKTTPIVSTGAQYHAPTSREGTAMKLGPGPKGV
jgi:hypothetical protein